jgi:AraC-like DNA-binding protein
MGKGPKAWFAEQRQHRAVELLRDGSSVKETATSLGYKQASTFSREFMKHSGRYPSAHLPPNKPVRAANVA